MSDSLYGVKKVRKLSGKELSSSNSLSFSSNLASLISGSAASKKKATATSKAGDTVTKPDIFTAHRARKRPAIELEDDRGQRHQTGAEIGHVSQAELERSKRRMEEKVRLYNAMKRGEYVQREDGYDDRGLVDFDRKWAQGESETDSESSQDDPDHELVSFIDEFGRTRKGTKKEAEKVQREKRIEEATKIERANYAAHPERPTNIIYGDAVQSAAFNPDRDIAVKMAELAKKRDRPATPPPDTHFDASAEIRTKGTGFYAFSHDAEQRQKQMDELEEERQKTERTRAGEMKQPETAVDRQANEFLDSIELHPE